MNKARYFLLYSFLLFGLSSHDCEQLRPYEYEDDKMVTAKETLLLRYISAVKDPMGRRSVQLRIFQRIE